MRRLLLALACGLLAAVPATAQQPGPDSTTAELIRTAALLARAAPEVSRVWPGYWPRTQPVLLLAPDTAGLLLTWRRAPTGYRRAPAPWLPRDLRRITYLATAYPEQFTNGRFSLAHPVGTDTAIALPHRGSSMEETLAFVYHEAFHGYQSRGHFRRLPEDRRRVRFGGWLADSAVTADSAFRAGAERERRLLLAALGVSDPDSLKAELRRYLGARRARTAGHLVVQEVERSMERLEGTAEYVGCRAAAVALGTGDEHVLGCLRAELERPVEAFPAAPEADARWLRWRLYGTGGALSLFLDRLHPGWQFLVEQGMTLDHLLGIAVEFDPRVPAP